MKHHIADTVSFHYKGSAIETGIIIDIRELATSGVPIYVVKVTDSATIVHCLEDDVISVIKRGLHTIVDDLVLV